MIKEALTIQNGCEDAHGFDEINKTMVAIFDGEVIVSCYMIPCPWIKQMNMKIIFGFPTSIMDLFKRIMFFYLEMKMFEH
jgi:hypothetical protein